MRATSSSNLNSSFRTTTIAKKPAATKKESSLNVSMAKAAAGRPGWDLKGRLEDMELKLKAVMEKNEKLDNQVSDLNTKVGDKDTKCMLISANFPTTNFIAVTQMSEVKSSLQGSLDGRQEEVLLHSY